MSNDPRWTPFEIADLSPVNKALDDHLIYINSRYQVNVRFLGQRPPFGHMAHLSIKRIDKAPIRNWRDLQRIKNELCGPECDAVEVFPRESQLVDTANQFHLWVFATYEFPFGFKDGRLIADVKMGNSVQEPFEDRPPDCNSRVDELRATFVTATTSAALDLAKGIAKK